MTVREAIEYLREVEERYGADARVGVGRRLKSRTDVKMDVTTFVADTGSGPIVVFEVA